MAKRQIPFLSPPVTLADGTVVYHWKPSPRLRRAGFTNRKLGSDRRAAILAAIDLNEQVRAWEEGQAAGAAAVAPARALPRVVRFGELIARYRQHDAYTGLRASSRRGYDAYLNRLEHIFLDGELPVRDITKGVVQRVRDEQVAAHSAAVAAYVVRVLRLLMSFAVDQELISANPCIGISTPLPAPRRTQMGPAVRDAIVEAAHALGMEDVAFAVTLDFWMVQRRADVLNLGRFAWREIRVRGTELDPTHRAVLVNPHGRIMGFRLAQQKTGTWVDAPIPPALHEGIEARFRGGNKGWLFPDPDDADEPIAGWKFARRFSDARGAAWAVALMRDDPALAEAIITCRFSDLRRTGMIAYGNAGAPLQWITALSGHAVLGRRTILDTYMPGDTPGACACVATGLLAEQHREANQAADAP